MGRLERIAAALVVALGAPGSPTLAADPAPGVERLYVLNCGEGVAGDIGRWSPGVNEGKSMPFANNCYLVKHARGWLLWDTGVPDAVASMPEGLKPADPRATTWRRPKTLASQLAEIGVRPGDLAFVAVSHTHPDHVGNLGLFPTVPLLIQRKEYEWAFGGGKTPFSATHPTVKLEGDRDVFGDGSVTILSTPGHTPGHESLLVHLPKTGWVAIAGDAAHFQANWEARRVPSINFDRESTLASMERLASVVRERHAQLWINHDQEQTTRLRHAPAAYE